jgi:hypothetical protein
LIFKDNMNETMKREVRIMNTLQTITSEGSNKSLKGGTTMKGTGNISLKEVLSPICQGMMALGILAALCMPPMTTRADAAGHSNYYGMAAVAEQELRDKEQLALVKKEVSVATAIQVDESEQEQPTVSHKTDSSEKK